MQQCIEVFSLTVNEIKTEGICQCEHIAANWIDSLVVSRKGDEFIFYRLLDDSDYQDKYIKSKRYQRPGKNIYGSILQSSIPVFNAMDIKLMSYNDFCQEVGKWTATKKKRKRLRRTNVRA